MAVSGPFKSNEEHQRDYALLIEACKTLDELIIQLMFIHQIHPQRFPLKDGNYKLKALIDEVIDYVESREGSSVAFEDLPHQFNIASQAFRLKLNFNAQSMPKPDVNTKEGSLDKRLTESPAKPSITIQSPGPSSTNPSFTEPTRISFPISGPRTKHLEDQILFDMGCTIAGVQYPLLRGQDFTQVKSPFVSPMCGKQVEYIHIDPSNSAMKAILKTYIKRQLSLPVLTLEHCLIEIMAQTREYIHTVSTTGLRSGTPTHTHFAWSGLVQLSSGEVISKNIYTLHDIAHHGEGCCRHHAHLNAYILGQCVQMGLFPNIEQVYLFQEDTNIQAHQVCLVQTSDGSLYYLDSGNFTRPITLYTPGCDNQYQADHIEIVNQFGTSFYAQLVKRCVPYRTLLKEAFPLDNPLTIEPIMLVEQEPQEDSYRCPPRTRSLSKRR